MQVLLRLLLADVPVNLAADCDGEDSEDSDGDEEHRPSSRASETMGGLEYLKRTLSCDYACALRAVTSVDGMTADYYPFEHSFLAETATRIINEVTGINRITYDITSKPPGTIEWE